MEIKLREGRVHGSFVSTRFTIKKGEAATLLLPSKYGHVLVSSQSVSLHGCLWYRGAMLATEFGGSWDILTIPLTGTTGTDGRWTFSAVSNKLYIENRKEDSIELSLTFTG